MTEAQVKKLNKQLPEPERDWIDAIPEIFGKKWKEEGLRKGHEEGLQQGLQQGREETIHAVIVNMIEKFPDWSDPQIAELTGVTHKFVQQLRRQLAKKK